VSVDIHLKAIVIFSKNYHPLWLIRIHSSIPLSPYNTSFYHTKYVCFVKIDGFEQDRRVVVIAATNRKEDLDPALIRWTLLLVLETAKCMKLHEESCQ